VIKFYTKTTPTPPHFRQRMKAMMQTAHTCVCNRCSHQEWSTLSPPSYKRHNRQ